MKKCFIIALLTFAAIGSQAQVRPQAHGYPIDPVPFTSVKVTDSFWGQRLKASREVTIPLAFSKCEETGRYQNFVRAAHPCDTIKVGGFSFDDTDVYKTRKVRIRRLGLFSSKMVLAAAANSTADSPKVSKAR